jgi:hypothetical protein
VLTASASWDSHSNEYFHNTVAKCTRLGARLGAT